MEWIYREYKHGDSTMPSKKLAIDWGEANQMLTDLEAVLQSDMCTSASYRFSDSNSIIIRRERGEFRYWLDDGFCEHELSRDEFLEYIEAALVA